MDFDKVSKVYFEVVKTDPIKGKTYIKDDFIENELRVYKQSIRHNVWLKEIDLIKDKFPNENDAIQKYRNTNKRQFTKEVPRKIVQGVVSCLSNIPLEVRSNNSKFLNWFDSEPFMFSGDKMNFMRWSINSLIPYAFIDPNAILVPFPKFIDQFTPVEIKPKIIAYNMRYVTDDFVIILKQGSNQFYVADKMELFVGTVSDKITYELIYPHNLGELPFTYLPGLYSFDATTNKQYNESILSSTYEYLDESLVSFTTDQAIRLKMNSILIRPGLKCGNSGCDKGTVINQEGRTVDCPVCKGTGLAKRPSDLDDFVVPPGDSMQGENQKIVEPKYINPETAVAEFHSRTWKEYLFEAKKSVGIDALIDKSESGEAMKKRLASFEEFISYLLFLTYKTTGTKFFEMCHKLLNVNKADWIDFPLIVTPKRIEIKTPEILKQNFNEAIGSEKIQAAREYYNSIYQDNELMKTAMSVLIKYYPASLEKNEDLQILLISGVYTSREIAKSRRALNVIIEIIENKGVEDLTQEQIYKQTESILDTLVPDRLEISNVN